MDNLRVSKHEYWEIQFDKLEKDYDLAVRERRVTKFLKENNERINGLFQLRLEVGLETLAQFTPKRES